MMNLKLDQFLKTSQFATTATIQTDPVKTVNCIFDNAFTDANTGEIDLETTQPRLVCKSSDVEGIPRETMVEVLLKNYSILEIQPDGTGMSTVLLAHEI
jgi:hypothetical protein